MEGLLEVTDLQVAYRVGNHDITAVDRVNLGISRGEVLGIVGESGSGKSTLALSSVRLLPRNARILSGKSVFNGINIYEMESEQLRRQVRWKGIAIVFQGAMNSLNPVVRVGAQIVEAIKAHELVEEKAARSRAKALLVHVGIPEERYNSFPHELSGGTKQRIMIAMALSCNPQLLIADEPTNSLDVIVAAQIFNLLRSLRKELGLSMIIISHDITLLAQICDRIAVMYAGKIVEVNQVPGIINEPSHPYTQGLLSALMPIENKMAKLNAIPGVPVNLANPPNGCRFHPRCAYEMSVCRNKEPLLKLLQPKHSTACHLYE